MNNFYSMRMGLLAVACALVASPAFAQALLQDDFDSPRGRVGASPEGWTVTGPDDTGARIVDEYALEPHSPPFAVELFDDSSMGRPVMHRSFASRSTGEARFRVRVNEIGEAPFTALIQTSNGGYLFAIVLSGNGRMGYDHTTESVVRTDVAWTPGVWHEIRVVWRADGTFDAWLDDQRFAEGIAFHHRGTPGRIAFASGYGEAMNRRGYVDSVVVDR